MSFNREESFNYGVSRRFVDDEQIAIIKTQGNMNPRSVDEWAAVCVDTIHQFPAPQPICVLHDLRAPSQGFSAYVRQRSEEIFAEVPSDQMAYTAIILANTFMNRIIGFYLRTRPSVAPNHQVRIFLTVEDGLNWLRNQLQEQSA